MDCCSPGDSPFDRQFNDRHAAQDLRAYRQKGSVGLTRALIEALAAGGIDGQTVLEIGGGVGAVHHELLRSGAAAAVDVDASRAYISVAREEADRQGHGDRVRYLVGDFVALADAVQPADLVALDRVICCYEDMVALVGRSANLARRRYGLIFPRDSWLGRVGTAILNAQLRLSRSPFRVYVHRAVDVDAILAAHGLVKRLHRTTLIWQLVLYERPAA
ncbi:MAG: methyltransferase domain-containing protein [Chloroflexi bacterium]|nr:methyltransferase domain-containing protein [Chloroflexota bacterium]